MLYKQVVTGAFGYSGKYIAQRLLAAGEKVCTLTNSSGRENSFGGNIEVRPLNFNNSAQLVESLSGTRVLYNTYWVRFNHKDFTHQEAVTNTFKLFAAAKEAGVQRVVHVSITNPRLDSPLEYFKGKAEIEKELIQSGLSYCILRPAVLFGKEDILINNIAWALRRLPVFGVFGDGGYGLQPIYVDDLAQLAIQHAQESKNEIIDAIGPETFTYRELATTIGDIIGRRRPIIGVPPWMGYMTGWLLGKIVGDVLITREEIQGLMANLLCTRSSPTGSTRLTDWAKRNADRLGTRYANELFRRQNREAAYDERNG
ncbi:MAG: NAD(P)H-binding protein [Deltaproteobacteria bacterium]|nr:NAD(P)H-binding protein [Deltaproteobacteria bacterium]